LTSVNFIPAPDQGDTQVAVLGAELRPTVIAIVVVTTIDEELVAAGFFDPQEPKLKVEDDVGTEYRRSFGLGVARIESGGGWSRSHGVRRLILEFKPPVPPDASRLRITLGRRGSVVLTV
jgi:hypothetical protein